MDYNVRDMALEYGSEHSRKRMWAKILMVLAAVTVFCTVYALIMPVVAENTALYCGMDEHQHTEACYSEGELVCALSEHTHTAQCYSDPEADTEDESVWEAQAAAALKGTDAGENIIAVADAQNGYTESTRNYMAVDETVRNGYTRYGDWFGGDDTKYEDWNVSFVAFVLHYAGVDDAMKPQSLSAGEWFTDLLSLNVVFANGSKDPQNGYLVFFDDNADYAADRVAVVTDYSDGKLTTIEGDVDGAVRYVGYTDLSTVIGYARTYDEKISATEPESDVAVLDAYVLMEELLGSENTEGHSVNGLEMSKTAVYDEEKKQYVITIDSYASAESIQAYETKENDIVLLLDVSGSMDDELYVGNYSEDKTILDRLDKTKDSGYYFIGQNAIWKSYAEMRYKDGQWQYYKETDYWFIPSFDWTNIATDDSNLSKIYTEDKMGPLKDSVNDFLDYLSDNSNSTGADHRVSIITFSDNAKTVCDFTSVRDNLSQLKGYVNSLRADGATYADSGMQAAYTNLFGTSTTARKDTRKVVVMFTDGEPNHDNGFVTSVADSTIASAKKVKAAGATIYTIGLFDEETDNIRTYMNYVSSNYPEAESMTVSGEKNSLYTDSYSFYNLAQTEGYLNFDFAKVASEIITSSLFSIPSELAVFRDTVTEYFDVGDVELYTADSYVDDSKVKFHDAVKVSSSNITTNEADPELYNTKYSVVKNVNSDGTTSVVVRGFDFASKYCTLIHEGQKFIIKIYITPKADVGSFETDTDIYTNSSESGLYIIRDNKLVRYFNRPTAETYEYTIRYVNVDYPDGNLATPVNKKLLRGSTLTAAPISIRYFYFQGDGISDGSQIISETNTDIVFYYKFQSSGSVTPKTIKYESYGNGKVALVSNPENPMNAVSEEKKVSEAPEGATAIPDKGYRFKGWYLTTTDIDNQSPVTTDKELVPSVMDNITYYAVFEEDVYSLTVEKSVVVGGSDMIASFEFLATDTDGNPVVLTATDLVVDNAQEAEIVIDQVSGKITFKLHAKGDINKKITINNIPNGANVSVVETKHDGYYVLTKINNVTQDGLNDSVSLTIQNADADVEFINSTGYELPHTGGSGTQVYMLSGIIIMVSAAALILLRKKEQETI